MTLRSGVYLAVAAAAFAAFWWLVDTASTNKVSKATETYNQENRDAADRVAEARQRVRACHADGGVWDRQAGKCHRSVPQPR